MKLLLVIVSLIAIFTADCRDIPDEPEGRDSGNEEQQTPDPSIYHKHVVTAQNITIEPRQQDITNEDQQLKKINLLVDHKTKNVDYFDSDQQQNGGSLYTDEIYQNTDSSKVHYRMDKEERGQSKEKLRRLKCKARNACVVMGGFCVTNATLCNGRLVPEGCNGPNCQCCVPGTLETMINDLERKLSNITDVNMQLNVELESMKSNMNESLSNIGSQLQTIMEHQDCPRPLFRTHSSNQCFKFLNDTYRSWTAAGAKCRADGLILAKPNAPMELRNYIMANYGPSRFSWLDAKGDGSALQWQRGGQKISSTSNLWYPGNPSSKVSTSNCLQLSTNSNGDRYPTQPYYSYTCTSSYNTICELVFE